ncbi:hypothetical protein J7T55_005440 [Diaporthe amygdali]|uniref:uncharacterized protein n=1 Tax=Phomopsis amygdali TaxID=1214568 RepID=UPI0022FECD1B|nr:uncharacterized protein J7T55_005440 [Diaporthe amygdali]KAJ0108897.1 hypothetical protein J7T55_005440 [Diaporthe amygdali]
MRYSSLVLSLVPLAFADCEGPSNSTVPSQAPANFTFDELYSLTTKFLDSYMYPNNSIQALSINSTLFSEDVIGRVDATRDFVGRELNTEYIFGLFSELAINPDAFSLLGTPMSYKITHFAANQNVAVNSAVVQFYSSLVNITYPVEILFWATYNSLGQISQYDATFKWLQWNFDTISGLLMNKLNMTSSEQFTAFATSMMAKSICTTAMNSCNGTNTQYDSMDQCVSFLTNDVPFGSAYQLGFDTLLCRMAHQPMVPIRPSVHCSHIGPSGGDYCKDERTYGATVQEPLFTNQPFVPYGYADSDANVAAQ